MHTRPQKASAAAVTVTVPESGMSEALAKCKRRERREKTAPLAPGGLSIALPGGGCAEGGTLSPLPFR